MLLSAVCLGSCAAKFGSSGGTHEPLSLSLSLSLCVCVFMLLLKGSLPLQINCLPNSTGQPALTESMVWEVGERKRGGSATTCSLIGRYSV
jgi:hypothetical protein